MGSRKETRATRVNAIDSEDTSSAKERDVSE